ncbi:MAG: AAA family ATPase [Caldilineaceae bacterium SB0665_bin_21]|nr:AAA family ATPase [Caldilineaceae bacterium SB0665_bin_21]
MKFVNSIKLDGLLSFAPGSQTFELEPLNVLIGPNGVGKSNVIEAFELLRSMPTNFADAVRDGGGAGEWLWKGRTPPGPAVIDSVISGSATPTGRDLRHTLKFTNVAQRVEVLDEAIEEAEPFEEHSQPYFYYRFQEGNPVINVRQADDGDLENSTSNRTRRFLKRQDLLPDQSVLAQREDPDLYPEVTWLGREFGNILTFREWTFGRYGPLRQSQPATLRRDHLLPGNQNLGMVLNRLQYQGATRFDQMLKQFLHRYESTLTSVSGGFIQFSLRETGFDTPIPATRLSDGTVRFIALLAILLDPTPPPLVCIEEPELGLHPDAVALLGELLIEASDRMQLVVTTHSDALVSALSDRPHSVVACEWSELGTELSRLDPQQLDHWLESYQLGDVWRMGALGANP